MHLLSVLGVDALELALQSLEKVASEEDNNNQLSLAQFISVLLNPMTTALLSTGFVPPEDSMSPTLSLRQIVEKLVKRELSVTYNTIIAQNKNINSKGGSSSWLQHNQQQQHVTMSDVVSHLLQEVDIQTATTAVSGVNSLRLGGGDDGAISFEAASSASLADRVWTSSHTQPTPARHNQSAQPLYVDRWPQRDGGGASLLVAVSSNNRVGFETMNDEFETVRLGYARDKMAAIIDFTITNSDVVCAVHADSTTSFWSLPGVSYSGATLSHESEMLRHNDAREIDSNETLDRKVVLFKTLDPSVPEGGHVRVLRYLPRCRRLVSGSASGAVQLWTNEASADVVQRLAPLQRSSLRVTSSHITCILQHGGSNHHAVVTGMDRTVSEMDLDRLEIVTQRGGKKGRAGHSAGILCATSVPSSGSSSVVCTGGFDETIFVWNLDLQAHPPMALSDPSSPHRDKVVFLSACRGEQLISGDASGILKVWDLRMLRCLQTVAVARLGDDEAPPPLMPETRTLNRMAQTSRELRSFSERDADASVVSARVRRVFHGTSVHAAAARHFAWCTTVPGSASVVGFGPRSTTILQGNGMANATSDDKDSDSFVDTWVCSGVAVVPCCGSIVTIHADHFKVWSITTAALQAVVSLRPGLSAVCGPSSLASSSTFFAVGCSRSFVSIHSVLSASSSSSSSKKHRVFPTEESVLSLVMLERESNVGSAAAEMTIFAVSNCGSAAVLELEGGGSTVRRLVNLKFLARNFAALEKFAQQAGLTSTTVLRVGHDGTVSLPAEEEAQQKTFVTQQQQHQQQHLLTSSRSITLRSFRHQVLDEKNAKKIQPSSRSTKELQREVAEDTGLHFEENISLLPICYDAAAQLIFFASATSSGRNVLLPLDAHTLEIVHCFIVAPATKISAMCSLGLLGAVAVLDEKFIVRIFGTRHSHLANQLLCEFDASRAHPNSNSSSSSSSLAMMPPPQISFLRSTGSILVAQGTVMSSWSLRQMRRQLLMRPLFDGSHSRTTHAARRTKLLRQLRGSHVSAPADAAGFGAVYVAFEFRRGPPANEEEEEEEEEKNGPRKGDEKTSSREDAVHIDLGDEVEKVGNDHFLEVPSLAVEACASAESAPALPICGPPLHASSESGAAAQARRQRGNKVAHDFDVDETFSSGIQSVVPIELWGNKPLILSLGYDRKMSLWAANMEQHSGLVSLFSQRFTKDVSSSSSAAGRSDTIARRLPTDERCYLDPSVDLSRAAVARLLAAVRQVRVKLAHQQSADGCAKKQQLPSLSLARVLSTRLDAVQQKHGSSAYSADAKLDPTLRSLMVTPTVSPLIVAPKQQQQQQHQQQQQQQHEELGGKARQPSFLLENVADNEDEHLHKQYLNTNSNVIFGRGGTPTDFSETGSNYTSCSLLQPRHRTPLRANVFFWRVGGGRGSASCQTR